MYSLSFATSGQASAYRFLAVFNPLSSTREITINKASCIGYASVVTTNNTPLLLTRITTSTSGSLQSSSIINKCMSEYSDSAVEVRTTNPTVTTGATVFSFAPPIQGLTVTSFSPVPQWIEFDEHMHLEPGEGVCFQQGAAGLTAQQYTLYLAWLESPI